MKANYNELRTEQRQHISLSQYAHDTICNDALEFMGEVNKSGFINKIIQNFYENANASISMVLKQQKISFRSILHENNNSTTNIPLSPEEERILNLLSNAHITKTLSTVNSYSKDIALKIRLNNFVYDLLYPSDYSPWSESDYYPTQGAYIKALIEEYSRKSFFEREEIYYKDIIDTINNELSRNSNDHRLVAIKYLTGSKKINTYTVKLFKLTTQSERNYHYLIGLSDNANADNPEYVPAAFRISRIISIKPYAASHGSGKITKSQQVMLQNEITTKGIEFLIGHTEKIQVQLSKQGLQMYRNIIHLRPTATDSYTDEYDNTVLSFECTASQIRYYFFQFGKEVTILEPKLLAEDFENRYKQAYLNYQKGDYTNEITE